MPRTIKNKSIIELVTKGKAAYVDDSAPTAINESVRQILVSCNSIVNGFTEYYESVMQNIDYSHINNLKNAIVELVDQIEKSDGKSTHILEALNVVKNNINTIIEFRSSIMVSLSENQTAIINKIDSIPVADMKEINNKLATIQKAVNKQIVNKQPVSQSKKKEWDFDMVRDMDGRLLQVKAKEIH